MKQTIYFFIGTEAELIKVFPVIIECQNNGIICQIIASGQNDLKKSRILEYINPNGQMLELSKESDIIKSATGLLQWFWRTKKNAKKQIIACFGNDNLKGANLVVHGDTVSTMMGAMVGKKLKMRVCHVEAGLRSHNLLNPFPEEIDRLVTSRMARVHFAPSDASMNNLSKAKGQVINTQYNTILDSLAFSRIIPVATSQVQDMLKEDYFVFVMHRQENLMNTEFVGRVVAYVKKFAKKRKCVLILHKITENTFQEMGILDELKSDKKFVLLPRVDYFDFMKLLENAQYVLTDGGSNQEELYYMGKPCLIMRKTTERNEGLGQNAILYDGRLELMEEFEASYKTYERDTLIEKCSPSKIICNHLLEYLLL